MLPKNKRLNLKQNFKWVASGKRLETKNFKVFIKDGENESALVGIAITTSAFKKATLRNKAKRIASNATLPVYKDLRKSVNLVIMPKTGVLVTPIAELILEIQSLKPFYE